MVFYILQLSKKHQITYAQILWITLWIKKFSEPKPLSDNHISVAACFLGHSNKPNEFNKIDLFCCPG